MSVEKLQADWEKAEAHAVKLSNQYSEAREKARERFQDRVREANQKAADAQKRLNDAKAIEGLKGRDDAEEVAAALGLELPKED